MKNASIQVRPLCKEDFPQIQKIQTRYAGRYPGTTLPPLEVYRSPGFADGANILCAVEADGRLLGYAPLFPALVLNRQTNLPHVIWAEIKVDPSCARPNEIRSLLLECVYKRSRQLVAAYPPRRAQIIFQYFPHEEESVQFLFQQGFIHIESVFQLRRDLGRPIPVVLPPPGMRIIHWRMQSETEQRLYVDARNEAFSESPLTLEDWRYFMQSPLWEMGTCLAAFDGAELAGSVTLFWDEAQNQKTGAAIGNTEYIFVLPRWRGLGLGRYLIAQGLNHLKKHGLQEAQLEVKAANSGAIGLYTKLGYEIASESWFLANTL